jgi:hypothetical protein
MLARALRRILDILRGADSSAVAIAPRRADIARALRSRRPARRRRAPRPADVALTIVRPHDAPAAEAQTALRYVRRADRTLVEARQRFPAVGRVSRHVPPALGDAAER